MNLSKHSTDPGRFALRKFYCQAMWVINKCLPWLDCSTTPGSSLLRADKASALEAAGFPTPPTPHLQRMGVAVAMPFHPSLCSLAAWWDPTPA